MEQELNALLHSAKAAIQQASDSAAIELLRVQYLGKKGELTTLLKGVGQLPADQKPQLGKAINVVKQTLQSLLADKMQALEAHALNAKLESETIDVTLPGRGDALGSMHPVTQTRERVIQLFSAMGFRVADGPEIEDEYHNFEALNIPAEHPARDAKDTFYFSGGRLLRTHTSNIQIREMKQHGVPIRLVALGRVYRRDSDQTHTPMFHQVEGLVVEKKCTFSDLKGVLHDFLNQFFGMDLKLRFRPSYFPFTEPSAEVDIYKPATKDWLEVLGCGMVHPNVLRNVGVDPDEYTGFAFGMGLDRLAMLRYQIPDLRLLFTNDLQFLKQF